MNTLCSGLYVNVYFIRKSVVLNIHYEVVVYLVYLTMFNNIQYHQNIQKWQKLKLYEYGAKLLPPKITRYVVPSVTILRVKMLKLYYILFNCIQLIMPF